LSEHDEQVALFQWAGYQLGACPELALMFAIPNGGDRHPAVAGKLRDEGVKPGVPDICLPVPRGKYHGMFLEMKFGKNKPKPDQFKWMGALRDQGYYVRLAWDWQTAAEFITRYLEDRNET